MPQGAFTATPQRLVEAGYDAIADEYLRRFAISAVRRRWLNRLIGNLRPAGGHVLDLGCGAGLPIARDLIALNHTVVGVDASVQQISRARRNIPQATFIHADMCEVAFEASCFDAVGAFYSMIHLQAFQQAALIARVAAWLRPGGVFVASFGIGEPGEWVGEWLGTTMFFGHRGKAETLESLEIVGLRVVHSAIEKQDNEDTAFLWIEAVKDRNDALG